MVRRGCVGKSCRRAAPRCRLVWGAAATVVMTLGLGGSYGGATGGVVGGGGVVEACVASSPVPLAGMAFSFFCGVLVAVLSSFVSAFGAAFLTIEMLLPRFFRPWTDCEPLPFPFPFLFPWAFPLPSRSLFPFWAVPLCSSRRGQGCPWWRFPVLMPPFFIRRVLFGFAGLFFFRRFFLFGGLLGQVLNRFFGHDYDANRGFPVAIVWVSGS